MGGPAGFRPECHHRSSNNAQQPHTTRPRGVDLDIVRTRLLELDDGDAHLQTLILGGGVWSQKALAKFQDVDSETCPFCDTGAE
eukprot:4002901-Alexandrium_andersonii.AAC.1